MARSVKNYSNDLVIFKREEVNWIITILIIFIDSVFWPILLLSLRSDVWEQLK